MLTGTGIAFICAASVAGCFTSGQSGDPGAGFLGGPGNDYRGTAGSYGSGTAGARSTGGADAGTAGATGEGGAICGVIMATPDGGAPADGAANEAGAMSASDASTHDGGAANEAGATTDASPDGSAATEVGAAEAGTTEGGTTAVCTVGAISLTWSLERAGTTIAETCAQAGVAKIRLVANTMNVDFQCDSGAGRTPALAAGTYAVSLHALDATGASVSDTSTMNVTVAAGQIVSLGEAVFDVD
ncbi:MAG TPA: hypothetical protein VK989_00515 [Polyangia bacterium]|nr:hypothetical protein [Polyangia bacterium]